MARLFSNRIGALAATRTGFQLSSHWFAKDDGVAAVQTAFEVTYVNTHDKHRSTNSATASGFPSPTRPFVARSPSHDDRNGCTGRTPRFVAIDPDGVVIQDGFAIDVDRFIRAVAESGPTVR